MSQDRNDPQPKQSENEPRDRDRREAMQRMATYTAPAMLALLMSEKAVAQTTATPSDIRLKRNVTRVGSLPNGLNVYRYRYLWSDTAFVGVMAHEVAKTMPGAVKPGPNGYLRVDYARLGTRLQTFDEWVPRAAPPREGERVAI
jgi:hypothetical protein